MAISHPGSGCGAWDPQGALAKVPCPRLSLHRHSAAAWPPRPTVPELRMVSLMVPEFIPPGNPVSRGRTTWAVVSLAAPGAAACQGLALAQPHLLPALTVISRVHGWHNPRPSSAGRWVLGGCGQGQASMPGPAWTSPCCGRWHRPASPGMGPTCGCAPGRRELRDPRHAQQHRNARHFGLSEHQSRPQPRLPGVRWEQRRQASCSSRRGRVGGDICDRCLPSWPRSGAEPQQLTAQQRLPTEAAQGWGRREGGIQAAPGAGCRRWLWGSRGCWRVRLGRGVPPSPSHHGLCPAPAAASAVPVLGPLSATAGSPRLPPPSLSASWLLSNSLRPFPIFLLDRRSRLMHLEILWPFLVAVD